MIVLVVSNKCYEFKLLIVLDTDLGGSRTIKCWTFFPLGRCIKRPTDPEIYADIRDVLLRLCQRLQKNVFKFM